LKYKQGDFKKYFSYDAKVYVRKSMKKMSGITTHFLVYVIFWIAKLQPENY